MSAIGLPGTALGWLGRQGTRAIAVVVFIGIAAPSLDALVKPFVPDAIFALLCIAFLRVETAALRAHLGRPGLLVAVTAWTMLVIPALVGGAGLAVGLPTRTPDLFLALMLQAVASPMMAAPAFAAVMGLDATLVLVTPVTSSALTPLTVLGLAVLAFAVCYALLGLTALVLAGAGPERAFALGLMASQRNMGLMVAATGNALPEVAWLYFALCQFPIYLSPQLLKPLARRVLARPSRQ